MRRFRLNLILMPLLAAMLGCSTSDKRQENLEAVLRHYERSIKWGSYTEARMLAGESGPQENADPYKEIKVISYEVVSQKITGDFQKLEQVVEIKFYHEQQARIQTLRDTQVWLYDEARDTWILESGFPDFLSALK